MTTAEISRRPSVWLRLLRQAGPLLVLLVVYLLFAGLEAVMSKTGTVFFTSEHIRSIGVNSVVIAVCAMGMTVVIIAGGIDLSVGSGVALCATVLACGLKLNWSTPLVLLLTIFTGMTLGALNGVLVSVLRVVPFIITLGTMTAYLGSAKMLAEKVDGGQTVRPAAYAPDDKSFAKNQVPVTLQQLTSVRAKALWPTRFTAGPARPVWDEVLDFIRMPLGIWLALVFAGLMAGVLQLTVFGRHVFALGSNEATARLCGVNVPLTRIAVYTICGLFVALAGIYQFSRLSSGNPTSGVGLELRVIAAVVIGGGSLAGGKGSILGTLAGAALMAVITSGCTQLEIPNSLQDVILGVIIIAAVALDQFRERRTSAA